MKRLITCSILLFTFFANAQDLRDNSLNKTENENTSVIEKDVSKFVPESEKSFEEAAEEAGIATRTFSDMPEVSNGYYAITAVLSKSKNLKKTVKKLTKKGFGAGFLHNPESELNYVYLNQYTDWKKAIKDVSSDFNGTYEEGVWLMEVKDGITMPEIEIEDSPVQEDFTLTETEDDIEEVASEDVKEDAEMNTKMTRKARKAKAREEKRLAKNEKSVTPISDFNQNEVVENDIDTAEQEDDNLEVDEVTYDMLNDVKSFDTPSVANSSNKSKLIQKADSYFNKMWYSEAAEIYEQALRKGEKNYTEDIIQKAAEAHYFNTNMEKAHGWYDLLYDKKGKDLSAENTFRYSHALKGIGKYGRAKRMMRLYNDKVSSDNGEIAEGTISSNEALLDDILATDPNYEIKNLAINSEYSDFSPMFLDSTQIVFSSAKDSSFLKTRKYKWNDQPYLDLFTAKIDTASQDLQGTSKFSKAVNTKYHEASATFSPDLQTMYFTRNNYGKKLKRDKNGINHLKIYVSNLVGGEWSEAKEVPFNSDDYSTGHPAMSPDGKKLYFVSDMPGSVGKTDVFVVEVLEGGQFSEPKNLGPEINTKSREMFPYINSKKLFFSSDGHVGLGGLDVFESTYSEDEGFGTVTNVGKPINSNMDDFSYIVDDENLNGYFASNRKGGKGDDDIYSFERTPENLNAIAGIVKEIVTDSILPEASVQLLDEEGNLISEIMTGEDGSFLFENLDSNTKYTLKSTKGQFLESSVDLSSKDNELVNQDLDMKRIEEMIADEEGIRKIKTEMIFFDFDKSYIRDEAAVELNKLVEVMQEYPNMVIKIESHTDSRGAAQYNKYLSDKRAKSTREYIISQGIDDSRIQSATGYGEEMLLNECNGRVRCTEAEHYRNRRSEFIIVDM